MKWVMKEAYFKMSGIGLTKEFNKVDNLEYKITKIFDLNNNPYFITCSSFDYKIKEVIFNNINK